MSLDFYENYMNYYTNDMKVDYNLNFMCDFFQTEEITTILHAHLKENMKTIIDKNPYKERYQNNNDVFIHIRLGDAELWNVGIDFYISCINNLNYNNIYIGTEKYDNELIQKLKSLYPSIIFFEEDAVKTIQYGSTCKNIILSHGSYSAMIGYLSFFSNVYFLNEKPEWCPLTPFLYKGFIPVILDNNQDSEEIQKRYIIHP